MLSIEVFVFPDIFFTWAIKKRFVHVFGSIQGKSLTNEAEFVI